MKQLCTDAFKEYDLPFECYFNACVDHDTISHDELEFIWILEGHITIECEGKKYDVHPDQVFIIYINQKHSMKSHGYVISASFRFKRQYLESLHLYFERLPFKNMVFEFDQLAQKYPEVPLIMSQLITLMESPETSINIRYRLIGYYNMYVYDLYSVRRKEKYLDIKKKNYKVYLARLKAISSYVESHYNEKISLETLANHIHISTFRLSHFIKEILGISFQEYLNTVRLEKAILDLKNTDLPIRVIVKNSGFSDQKYLNATLKQLFHTTAHQYRKIMKSTLKSRVNNMQTFNMQVEFSQKLQKIQKTF